MANQSWIKYHLRWIDKPLTFEFLKVNEFFGHPI